MTGWHTRRMPTMRALEHWTDSIPDLPCVACGNPVDGYELRNGYTATFEGAGPNGGPGTVIGAWDDIERSRPASSTFFGPPAVKPAPDFDKVTVTPCGHTLEHDQARQMMARIRETMTALRRQEVETTLARHADLLTAAEAAGHGAVVEQYRQAVHRRSSDQQGLLVALRTLTG